MFEACYLFEMLTVDIQLAYMYAAHSHGHRVRVPLRMCFDCKISCKWYFDWFCTGTVWRSQHVGGNEKHSKVLMLHRLPLKNYVRRTI